MCVCTYVFSCFCVILSFQCVCVCFSVRWMCLFLVCVCVCVHLPFSNSPARNSGQPEYSLSILIPKRSDLTFASRKTYAKVSRRDGETSRPQRQSVCYSRLKEGLMFTLSSVNKIENVLKSTPDPLYPDARIHMRESAYTWCIMQQWRIDKTPQLPRCIKTFTRGRRNQSNIHLLVFSPSHFSSVQSSKHEVESDFTRRVKKNVLNISVVDH